MKIQFASVKSRLLRNFVAGFFAGMAALSTAPLLAKAPFHQSGCQIHDEQGRCFVIVDFVPTAASTYSSTFPPGYPSVFPPRHHPQVVNLVYDYAQRYGFTVRGMTSWVGISFVAPLFRDQVEQLRDDPLVTLVTEDHYVVFSPGPPGQTFPPPFVAGEVTEYVNRVDFPKQPDGQFFYAAMDSDRALLDSVASWQRTGRSFKAAGSQSVCRLYGGASGGPNTHFYSLDKAECDMLRTLPFLSYEGQTFLAAPPLVAANGLDRTCAVGTIAVYRLYNNAYVGGRKNDWESNHRYVTRVDDIASAVRSGWRDEGVVFCQPS